MAITSFSGEYDFLSNFYVNHFTYDGWFAPTLEHHFQAAKTPVYTEKAAIIVTKNPADAKKLGRKCTRRPDWDEVKQGVMFKLLRVKFQNPVLLQQLLDTGDQELIEGNNWGDQYWGVCHGVGMNHLGKLLMDVRYEIRNP